MPAPENTLYATHDFIRPGEEPLYLELTDRVFGDLAPVGILECTLADEIRRAMWRLRRCGIVEENLAAQGDSDPMQLEAQSKIQQNVDRARAQAHRFIHKCTAELRKLQTERVYRNEACEAGTDLSHLGICDWPSIQVRLTRNSTAAWRRQSAEVKATMDAACYAPPAYQSGSNCKSTESPAQELSRAA